MTSFSKAHPAISLSLFTAVVVLTVAIQSPLLTATSLAFATALHLSLRKTAGLRALIYMLPLACALTLINPLLNTQGQTVLFEYMGGRPYTLEGLAAGAQTAAMLMATLLWFASFNLMAPTRQLAQLFGKLAPALALALTMTMRLVPEYAQKAREISDAREGIGLSHKSGTVKQRARDGASTLGALAAWALEGSITTVDSMRSRGYGCSRASNGKPRVKRRND